MIYYLKLITSVFNSGSASKTAPTRIETNTKGQPTRLDNIDHIKKWEAFEKWESFAFVLALFLAAVICVCMAISGLYAMAVIGWVSEAILRFVGLL